MNLTLQYTFPVARGTQCEHCDEFIIGEKFVRFSMGVMRLSFHKECFDSVLFALNKFDVAILRKSEASKVH